MGPLWTRWYVCNAKECQVDYQTMARLSSEEYVWERVGKCARKGGIYVFIISVALLTGVINYHIWNASSESRLLQ